MKFEVIEFNTNSTGAIVDIRVIEEGNWLFNAAEDITVVVISNEKIDADDVLEFIREFAEENNYSVHFLKAYFDSRVIVKKNGQYVIRHAASSIQDKVHETDDGNGVGDLLFTLAICGSIFEDEFNDSTAGDGDTNDSDDRKSVVDEVTGFGGTHCPYTKNFGQEEYSESNSYVDHSSGASSYDDGYGSSDSDSYSSYSSDSDSSSW